MHTRRANESQRVVNHMRCSGHLTDEFLKSQNIFARKHFRDDGVDGGGSRLGDPELFIVRRIGNKDLEHETILLCFGKRVGAFLLNRVLRRKNEEGAWQEMARAANRHLPFLHCF